MSHSVDLKGLTDLSGPKTLRQNHHGTRLVQVDSAMRNTSHHKSIRSAGLCRILGPSAQPETGANTQPVPQIELKTGRAEVYESNSTTSTHPQGHIAPVSENLKPSHGWELAGR